MRIPTGLQERIHRGFFVHTIPYSDIKSQLHAANYGNPKPLEEFIVGWMLTTLGKILSPLVIQIDRGDKHSFPLEMKFPNLEPRTEYITHRTLGRSTQRHLNLHQREWSRL